MQNKQRMNQSSFYPTIPTIPRAKRRSKRRTSGGRKTTRRVSQKCIARVRGTRSRFPKFTDFPGLSKDLWDTLQML